MKCPRCGANFNSRYDYCTNCIAYGKVQVGQVFEYQERLNKEYKYTDITLSAEQQKVSDKLVSAKKDILVDAVCGAGKTEICLEVISKYLKDGKRVGFVIPRKEVVKDVGSRLKELFSNNIVSIIHGESTSKTIGDITILTAHQCSKFTNAFNLLIIDEPDAFPYAGNLLLQKIVESCCVERKVYLSATPPKELLDRDIDVVELNARYHGRKHPIPIIIEGNNCVKEIKKLIKNEDKNIIFAPTIKLQKELGKKLGIDCLVNSKQKTNSSIVRLLEAGIVKNLIATSTLERGVTIPYCNVIIAFANHDNYRADTIVQMCGRVNRKMVDDQCKIFIICTYQNSNIKLAMKEIKRRNEL